MVKSVNKQDNRIYERKEIYSLDAIFDKVPELPDDYNHHGGGKTHRNKYAVDYDGDGISMASQRYQLFKKSVRCVSCGIEGSFFAKERNPRDTRYHFNLYAVDPEGEEILMTKDHIIPRSKGGPDVVSNYQTMCSPCNRRKGNSYVDKDTLRAVTMALQSAPNVWLNETNDTIMFCRWGHEHMGEPKQVVLETYFKDILSDDELAEAHRKCINRVRAEVAIAAYEKTRGKYQ